MFTVDVSQAGAGTLEIVVNDGIVPCSVVSCGEHKYLASFLAMEAVPHGVFMSFNGQPVSGSPWMIEVRPAVKRFFAELW